MSDALPEELLVVIVLSHNKRDQTLRCLESVRQLKYRPLEVLVVDNGSSDGSAEAVAAAYPAAHLLRSSANRGAAGGRNLGFEYAKEHLDPSYVLFLDDDSVVQEQLAGELVAAMQTATRVGLATPKAFRFGSTDVIASAGGMRVRLGQGSITDIGAGERDIGQFEQGGWVESCVGFTVLARVEALERCRGFDESYNPYGWEEVDLSLRIRQAGYTIQYVPRAICWHAGGTPGRGRRVARYERGKIVNYLRLMRRHATVKEWLTFLAVLPLRAARLAAAQARGLFRESRQRTT
ncbi:MAG TPA: glycosyltransferase family 2 protein [Gemmatimonadales bacterium]|nr:glycosyltransferase family 2 protein [Gemmatimonadales bacterium]